jgi:arginine decarboxylase
METRVPRPEISSDGEWTFRDSSALYSVPSWGGDFFSVHESGNLFVGPRGEEGPQIDFHSLVLDLERRGLRTPMLIRFSDILASRVQGIAEAFERAIAEYEYPGRYRGVYPIKVNQQRHVVEEIIHYGAPRGVGLEAGSKPELLIALAVLDTPGALIVCNGYKDRSYLETALLAQRLGRTPVIVIDRFRELDLLIRISRELRIRPHIGVRARLFARGAGKWTESSGHRSKFGLTPAEMVATVERLRDEDMLDCLELVHSHIGSQITSIRAHKEALREVSRVYVGLKQMGAELGLLDVGGGLAVDYDGTRTQFHSSMNYSLQEYANDVVSFIQECCDDADVPVPDIITESGRAMVAHHSVLVFDVLEVNQVTGGERPEPVEEAAPRVVADLHEIWSDLCGAEGAEDVSGVEGADDVGGAKSRRGSREVQDPETSELHISKLREAYNDTLQLRDEANTLFSLGYLDLADRARTERLVLSCCELLLERVRELDPLPEDLAVLEKELADTYYANFSVFQSAPDHWAVKQLFPVMPIHRLNERPTRRGIFADLTCDSDGRIDQFIGGRDVKQVLELHAPNGDPYYIGLFLVGAYQEILGDLHNLFGDTDAVHVRLDDAGGYTVEHVVEGEDVSDVLRYVQYEPKTLVETVRRSSEKALREGLIGIEDSTRLRAHYARALRAYTYLSRDEDPSPRDD